MLEIRFHGRGGQGTVLAAKILADAVLRAGRLHCLAIPEFGVERRGAPVLAYARLSDQPLRVRSRIYEPDVVVVLDPTIGAPADLARGLKPGGTVVVNTEKEEGEVIARWPMARVIVPVPARRIALSHKLGSATSPVVNTAMCGAVAAVFDICPLEDLEIAVREAVPAKQDANVAAAREAFLLCQGAAHART